ncbi:hypothetical protein [Clostridium sp.]|uniref:hypothetical protein n=1 Tax=Clostridium sp. TaxID=1506 RepID=UPI002FC77258
MYISEKNEKLISNFNFEPYLNKPLTKNDKDSLIYELSIIENGEFLKWTTLKKMLGEYYIESFDSRIYIDGKRTRVTLLTDSYTE